MTCGYPLADGQPVAMLALGAADDDERARCARGDWFTCSAMVAHAACLGLDLDTLDLDPPEVDPAPSTSTRTKIN